MAIVGKCPFCGTELTKEQARCSFCGAENMFYGVDPVPDRAQGGTMPADGELRTDIPHDDGTPRQRFPALAPGRELMITGILMACTVALLLIFRYTGLFRALPESVGVALSDAWIILAGFTLIMLCRCAGKLWRRRRDKLRSQPDAVLHWAQIVESVPVGDEERPRYRVRYRAEGEYRSLTTDNPLFRDAEGYWIRVYYHMSGGRWDPDTASVFLEPETVIPAGPEESAVSPHEERAGNEAAAIPERPVQAASARQTSSPAAAQTASKPSAAAGGSPSRAGEPPSGTISYEDYLAFEERAQPSYRSLIMAVCIFAPFALILGRISASIGTGAGLVILRGIELLIFIPLAISVLTEIRDNIRRNKLYRGPIRKVSAVLTKAGSGGIVFGASQLLRIRCRAEGREYRKVFWGSDAARLKRKLGCSVTVYVSTKDPGLYDIAQDSLLIRPSRDK